MSYSIADITGSDPRYRVEGDVYTILDNTQKVIFDPSNGPVYQNSLSIYRVSSTLDKANDSTLLQLNKDYKINLDDLDTTTMSKLYKSKDDPRGNIIKSITFTLPQAPILVSMDYNLVYSANPNSDPNVVGGDVALTPDLVLNMISGIKSLDVLRQWLINPSAIPDNLETPQTYLFDIDKTNEKNLIVDEVYNVNTYSRQNLIKPKHGSFFKDSVVIRSDNKTLVRDVDYVLFVDNIALTKQTANTGGIADCISIKPEFVGKIYLTYHVVGGTVAVEDISALYVWIDGIRQFLTTNSFVTEDNLNDLPVIKLHGNKLNEMENKMRSLLANATYKDTTTGKVSIRQLISGDNGVRWYTLATMSNVDGSTQLSSVDRFICNVQIPTIGYQAEVNVSVSVSTIYPNASIEVVNSSGPNDNLNITGTPTNTSYNNTVLYRCLYDINFGAVFQVGILAPNGTLAVQDNSGVESCWKLVLSDTDKTNGLTKEPTDGWRDSDSVIVSKFGDPSTLITLTDANSSKTETAHKHERVIMVGNVTCSIETDEVLEKTCVLPLPYSGKILSDIVVTYDAIIDNKTVRRSSTVKLTTNTINGKKVSIGSAPIGYSGNYYLTVSLPFDRGLSDDTLTYKVYRLYQNVNETINLLQLSVKV